jgi:hypothetical protein
MCRAVKLSIPPSTKRQRSSVMGMALFAREGGLNSAPLGHVQISIGNADLCRNGASN